MDAFFWILIALGSIATIGIPLGWYDGKEVREILKRPVSLYGWMARPRPAPTRKLYVIEVDFSVPEAQRVELDKALEPLRTKYGLDFFVKEPGITIRRFDDF